MTLVYNIKSQRSRLGRLDHIITTTSLASVLVYSVIEYALSTIHLAVTVVCKLDTNNFQESNDNTFVIVVATIIILSIIGI